MKIFEFLLFLIVFLLAFITFYYWKKQQDMMKLKRKRSKFDLVEISHEDHQYNEYYEPHIVEVVSTDEYL
ncbi:MAG: hypothetical protein IKQ06_02330 [Bacilli bacterium]|nr:hypothetical protein [Bacilli bacterium]